MRAWSCLTGLVFVVLAVIGATFIFCGPSDSSPAKMAAWYQSSSNRTHIHIGWVLTGVGLFALIWFASAVRERVRASEQATSELGTFLSTVVLVGGTVYIAVTMAAIAITDGTKTMSAYLLVVTAGAAMAALIFATSIAVRRYAILPGWLSWFGFVAGVAAIFSLMFFTMLVWLLWIAAASVALFLCVKAEEGRAPSPAPVAS